MQSPFFNNTTSLFQRIGIALLMSFLCRLLFYLFNGELFDFSPAVFLYGVRFDISAIAFLFGPFILLHALPFNFRSGGFYKLVLKLFFHLPNSMAILFNLIDIAYYPYVLKRSTADIFLLMELGNDVVNLIPQFMADYWYLLLIFIFFIALSEYLYKRTKEIIVFNSSIANYLAGSILFTALIGAIVIGARGGLQLRPLSIIDAGKYGNASNATLVLNSPFSIIRSSFKNYLLEENYYDKKELNSIYSPVHQLTTNDKGNRPNVVIIILESFSREYIGSLNNNKGYTPFLDSLISQGLVFENCFANGKKSMEGIPAIVASLPTLMNNPYITSPYSGNEINSLASILKKEGYSTSFFHGGTNGTLGLEGFIKKAGFDNYYGRYEYGNDKDFDGKWGIYDEPFFQYFANELVAMKKPFFSCFFSLSSHHPFSLPEQYREVFKEEKHPILKTVRYTDHALQRFFSSISTTSWYQNTLFVITADHTGPPIGELSKLGMEMYTVPLVFFKPGSTLKGRNKKVTQHIDIMPGILSQINYSGKFIAFGNNIFDDKNSFSISYLNNYYQLISGNYLLRFNGSSSDGLYHLKEDSALRHNLIKTEPETAAELERTTKAIIQSYNSRLINNRLTVR